GAAGEEGNGWGTPRREGTPGWPHTGGATTQALHMPREARPARRSSVRLLAMASPPLEARRQFVRGQHTRGIVRGADRRLKLLWCRTNDPAWPAWARRGREPMDVGDVLKQTPLFEQLSADDIDLLAQSTRLQTYRTGQVILREGHVGAAFFILV